MVSTGAPPVRLVEDRLVAACVVFLDGHQKRGMTARISALAKQREHPAALSQLAASIRVQGLADLLMGLRNSVRHGTVTA
jgi:hypothetical protein